MLLSISNQNYFFVSVTTGSTPSDFQKAKDACLNSIQDALLRSQWQRAAELMVSYLEVLENTTKDRLRAAPEVSRQENIPILNTLT